MTEISQDTLTGFIGSAEAVANALEARIAKETPWRIAVKEEMDRYSRDIAIVLRLRAIITTIKEAQT